VVPEKYEESIKKLLNYDIEVISQDIQNQFFLVAMNCWRSLLRALENKYKD